MAKKKITITLPEQIVDEFHLSEAVEVKMCVADQHILIAPEKEVINRQSVSLRWFWLPTLCASILFLCYLFIEQRTQISLVGPRSIVNLLLIFGVSSGVISFCVSYIQGKKNVEVSQSKAIFWRHFPAIVLSYMTILVFLVLVFFKVVGLMFMGATFDRYTATLLFFIFAGLMNYFMIYSALIVTPSKLMNILIMVILGGVIWAMITNRDHLWWQFNFSFLGTIEAKRRWQFNITLIFSALLMVALVDSLFVELRQVIPHSKRVTVLRILLTLTALDLGAVGLFPYTTTGPFQGVHNQVAAYLIYLMILLMGGIKWLFPQASKEFLILTYVIAAILVGVCLLFTFTDYFSLTAFELLTFVLAFSWMILLLQYLQKLIQTMNYTYDVSLHLMEND